MSREENAPRSEAVMAVARKLREHRNRTGMSLHQIEVASGGEWRAVVVGSYERGDRGMSLERFLALASWYRVPPAAFLPAEDRGDGLVRASLLDELADDFRAEAAVLRGDAVQADIEGEAP